MPITNDDQIDFKRVVTDPAYRRHVIVYLNAQARQLDRFPASQRSITTTSADEPPCGERAGGQVSRRLALRR